MPFPKRLNDNGMTIRDEERLFLCPGVKLWIPTPVLRHPFPPCAYWLDAETLERATEKLALSLPNADGVASACPPPATIVSGCAPAAASVS